jgi:hypothetical protein
MEFTQRSSRGGIQRLHFPESQFGIVGCTAATSTWLLTGTTAADCRILMIVARG